MYLVNLSMASGVSRTILLDHVCKAGEQFKSTTLGSVDRALGKGNRGVSAWRWCRYANACPRGLLRLELRDVCVTRGIGEEAGDAERGEERRGRLLGPGMRALSYMITLVCHL